MLVSSAARVARRFRILSRLPLSPAPSVLASLAGLSLSHKQQHSFVNVMVDSKYYHAQLPPKVNDVIEALEREPKLNEKTVLLEHLTDLVTDNRTIILCLNQRHRIVKQLRLWTGRKGRFDKVATVAWVIQRLGLQKELK
jgi:hypothetical protein